MFRKSILPLFTLVAMMAFGSCGIFSKSQKTAVVDGHNSKNSLDWQGVYQGVLPCADCDGIQTTLRLGNGNHYKIQTRYLGEKEKNTWTGAGIFTWDKAGQIVTLANGDQYFVGENQLSRLDQEGNRITGALAAHYNLYKMNGQLTETYWKLFNLNGRTIRVDSTFRREPYLILRDKKNRVSGNGGCNQIMGSYQLDEGGKISFFQMASTLMACPNLKTEQEFLKTLEEVNHYTINGDEMTLSKEDKALATFKAVYFN